MNLGENIYKYRTQKNMSQGDLADALDVSRQSVSKWENNNAVPDLEKLIKMSELFEISLDTLVGNPTQSEKPSTADADAASPVQQVSIQSSFRPVTMRQIIGVVFICIGLLVLPFALSAAQPSALLSCLLLAAPFLICGVICLKAKHHAGFLCLCILYLFTWLPMGVLAPNYIRLGFAKGLQLTHILCGAALALYGNRLKIKGTFFKTGKTRILFYALLGITMLISLLILLFPGLLPTPGLLQF